MTACAISSAFEDDMDDHSDSTSSSTDADDEERSNSDSEKPEEKTLEGSSRKACKRCHVMKCITDFEQSWNGGHLGTCYTCCRFINSRSNTEEGFIRNMVGRMERSHIRNMLKPVALRKTGGCAHTYETMYKVLVDQDRRCAVGELPLSLKHASDWQASPDRINNRVLYELTNVRLCALEFNGRYSWSKADLALFCELSTSVMTEEEQKDRAASATTIPKARSRFAQRVTDTGVTQTHCSTCDDFVDGDKMAPGRRARQTCMSCYKASYKASYVAKRSRAANPPAAKLKRTSPRMRTEADNTVIYTCNYCNIDKTRAEMQTKSKTECKECINARRVASVYHELAILVVSARSRTERRNAERAKKGQGPIAFNITIRQMIDVYLTQCGRCAYSNVPFQHRCLLRDDEAIHTLRKMSLERKDPRGGYTLENCALICIGLNSSDNTLKIKRSNGGSGGWNRLKWQYIYQWTNERKAGAINPSISWRDFRIAHTVGTSQPALL